MGGRRWDMKYSERMSQKNEQIKKKQLLDFVASKPKFSVQ